MNKTHHRPGGSSTAFHLTPLSLGQNIPPRSHRAGRGQEFFPEKEECFRLAFQEAEMGMALVDLDGHWLHANQALCHMLGYSKEELLETSFQEITHPDDLLTSLNHARNVLLGKNRNSRIEKRYIHRDGHVIWVRRTLSLIRGEEGEPRYFFVTAEDVGERIRTEEMLRRSEERFRQLAASSPTGIFLVDAKGDSVYTNPKCREITGLPEKETLGEEWKKWLHPEDQEAVLDAWAEAVRAGSEFHEEMRFVDAGGGVRWVQGHMVPLRDGSRNVTGYVGTCVNISELKHLQQRLVEQNAALEKETARAREASRLKTEFLTNMSHELRTPLNGIIGFSELLHDGKAGSLNPEQVEFLGDVLHSARHLLRLINDLLDMAKIEAGRMDIFPEPFLLRDAVAQVAASLQPLVGEKGISCTTSIGLRDDHVQLDRQKVLQILYNLLSNAIKFTPQGGDIAISAAPRGEQIELTVRDTGPGIRKEDLKRLFVEFEQLDPASNLRHPGTGLGLALARRFVAMHGGTIRVESEEGRGTAFIVLLPRKADRKETQ